MSIQTVVKNVTGWAKAYSRINWGNKTGLSVTNLNKMDTALDEIDNRIIILCRQKLDKDMANSFVCDWFLDEEKGTITVTFFDGTKKNYILKEKIKIATELIAGTVKAGPDIIVAKDGTMGLSNSIKEMQQKKEEALWKTITDLETAQMKQLQQITNLENEVMELLKLSASVESETQDIIEEEMAGKNDE